MGRHSDQVGSAPGRNGSDQGRIKAGLIGAERRGPLAAPRQLPLPK